MSTDPRENLADALRGFLTPEQLEHLVNEVLAVTKRVSAEFNCRRCGAKQMQHVEVSDAKAVALALPDLLNQAYGRPQEASVLAEPIRFYRLTKLEDLPQDAAVSRSQPPGGDAAPEGIQTSPSLSEGERA